jgi:ParB-like chromosome segregation protein Spo0J
MKEWGFTNPVLVDEQGGIIAGHGRIMAAQKLGYKEVPVMVANGWTEAQKKAFVLFDNKSSLSSSWNEDLLAVEMQDLQDLGFDLALTGFSIDELADILVDGDGIESSGSADDGPMVERSVSRSGDEWILGEHLFSCGSNEAKDVDAIVKLWEELTSKNGVLKSTGQAFADVASERKGRKHA